MEETSRYSYAAPPKALSRSSVGIKQILRSCNVAKIEKLVREGFGYKLIGEYSTNPKIRNILKAVPFYMARIDMLHDAVTKGQLKDVQLLTDISSPMYSVLKVEPENLIVSKDSAGVGLLHKAVYYDHPQIVEWLINNFACTMHVKDKLGRIPLHYVSVTSNVAYMWKRLVENGSRINVTDVYNHTPTFYLSGNAEMHLPDVPRYHKFCNREVTSMLSHLQQWIQNRDIDRLMFIIWEGYGAELTTQSSSKSEMKKFLDQVPRIMAIIREVHKAAVNDDITTLTNICSKPAPAKIMISKDENGVTPLHKASGLGNIGVVDYILREYPAAIYVGDNEGRIAAHYAAAFKQRTVYEKLLSSAANENIIEKDGRRIKYYEYQCESIDTHLLKNLPSCANFKDSANVYSIDAFDWTSLRTDNERGRSRCDKNEERTDLHLTFAEKDIELEEESVNKSKSIQPVSARTDSSKRSKKIDDDEECKSRNIVDDEAQTVQTITNIRNNESPPLDEKKSQENNETGRTVGHGEENDAGTPLSSDVTAETVEFSQLNEKYDERSETLGDTSVGAANVEEVAAESISNCNTLAEIGNFIIEGYGELLLNSKSNNEQIQRFINHLPIYLKQIDLIHECCIVGDLEELQKYLDRRKLAIARENKSSLYLTPLHIAVARNHRSVVKYLAGRFPETLKVVDKLGRTPLHFAAIHPDGKYVYNVLLTLGADKTVEDENNCTAEYYYEHPHIELYNQIKNTLKRLLHEEGLQSSVTPLTHTLESVMNFNQLEQDYILNVLGEALKKSLLAVVHARPTQPIKFLAEYLYGFANNMIEQESLLNEKSEREISAKKSEEQKILKHKTKAIFKDKEIRFAKQKRNSTVKNDDKNDKRKNRDYGNTNVNKGDAENTTVNKRDTENTAVSNTNVEFYLEISNQFHPLSRDKYGRTIIHYAATRIHSRNGFLQQLKELKGNVAYRDELYRTARDLAIFSENYENVKAIDEYVLQIVANGESEKITQLLLDGYDHIVEIECDEDVINCAKKRGHKKLLTVLKTIPLFEKTRDELHNAIRNGNKFQVIQLMRKCGKDASMMALCRSCTYRCSLHIAVLTEKKDIIEYLIKKFPETLCVGDNLDRTALHYAMALNAVEQLSNILIKAGADRTAKDLKGRQPSYYFINKHEILLMCPQELC